MSETTLLIASAVQTLRSGIAAANQAQANARIAERQSAVARQQAAFDEEQRRRETTRGLGRLRARAAKSGVRLEGSPLLALQEEAEKGKIDALSARFSGQLRAEDSLARARLTRARAQNNFSTSLLGTGRTILTGARRF